MATANRIPLWSCDNKGGLLCQCGYNNTIVFSPSVGTMPPLICPKSSGHAQSTVSQYMTLSKHTKPIYLMKGEFRNSHIVMHSSVLPHPFIQLMKGDPHTFNFTIILHIFLVGVFCHSPWRLIFLTKSIKEVSDT